MFSSDFVKMESIASCFGSTVLKFADGFSIENRILFFDILIIHEDTFSASVYKKPADVDWCQNVAKKVLLECLSLE